MPNNILWITANKYLQYFFIHSLKSADNVFIKNFEKYIILIYDKTNNCRLTITIENQKNVLITLDNTKYFAKFLRSIDIIITRFII